MSERGAWSWSHRQSGREGSGAEGLWGGKGGLWGSAESLGLRYPRRRRLSQRQDAELHLRSCGKIAFSWGDSQLASTDLRKLRTLLSMVQRESFGVEGDKSQETVQLSSVTVSYHLLGARPWARHGGVCRGT